jgi:lipoprotein signal peptidase
MQIQDEVQSTLRLSPRPGSAVEFRRKIGQRSVITAVFSAIIVLDQATKWWGWRHVSTARINQGGDFLVGSTVSGWFSAPVVGTLLDLFGVGLLGSAISILWRRRHSLVVLISASMMIAGWSSNLLDRLGLHYLTAPGSGRGAVDFIHIGREYTNVADVFIMLGTPLFGMAVSARYLAAQPATDHPAVTASR